MINNPVPEADMMYPFDENIAPTSYRIYYNSQSFDEDYDDWNDDVASLNHTLGYKKFSDYQLESNDKPIYNKVIDYIKSTDGTVSVEQAAAALGVPKLLRCPTSIASDAFKTG